MQKNKISIKINRPVKEVFDFTINPKNTPKWIDNIVEEKTNEWPIKIGTIYQNREDGQPWNICKVIELKPNKVFTLKQLNNDYAVRYTYKFINENQTELIYFEWVENGELKNPFIQDILIKLKQVIENKL